MENTAEDGKIPCCPCLRFRRTAACTFCHGHEAGLIGNQHFHVLALAVQNVPQCSILVAVVVVEICGEFLLCFCGTSHQGFDVTAGNCDRQQTYSSQNGVTSAYIVRNHESFIALCVGQGLQCALCLICGCKDVILGTVLAVLLFYQLLEHTECQSRLCGRAGLGNDVDRKISALADRDHFVQVGGVNVVAHIVDVRRVLLQVVVERGLQEFDRRTGTQIRTADTDHDQYLGILLDLLGSRLNSCEFFLVIVGRSVSQPRKSEPRPLFSCSIFADAST